MKSSMRNYQLKKAVENLKIFERNCDESKNGFEPSAVVCMYLIECLLPISDIYPVKLLRNLTITTSFNNGSDMLEFIDQTIERMKRVEHYALTPKEKEILEIENTVTAHEFLFDQNYNAQSQLDNFLKELLKRLKIFHEIMTDPRRNQAKLSYVDRTFEITITHIASVLEALSIGIANV